ncbi:family 16 glycosylhydrolase [Belliella kenyensis]|uniref:Family 16 glycosylhydrolase n=1 Tax=Belliella kenyensis TaxID=1472724 RepID=A0ABV8EIG2_9BACT|nr:glycoside hydrolase family 16 protein [Belliella kenyensis]MCH7400988.1 glycoside hydrolase family 16 protein [Belliella kenyensis]MDN3603986.1 glycoside hydrolase family 16 protein [Belliella kenyensis]
MSFRLSKNFKNYYALVGVWVIISSNFPLLYAQSLTPSILNLNGDFELIWSDEFDSGEAPNSNFWSFEQGFVRNNELQYYQKENAFVKNGLLIIEGRRERVVNSNFESNSKDWRKNQSEAAYSSSSINTKGKMEFQYGILEVRAKIDTSLGMWPAIWTLGVEKQWPANGEIDILEFYRRNGQAYILANAAWKGEQQSVMWDESKIEIETFINEDEHWPSKFHTWTMDWDEKRILLYLDGLLLNQIDLSKTINPEGFNPFHQPHYLLLNLAIGSNGGNPKDTVFPKQYIVDYVRVFQKK